MVRIAIFASGVGSNAVRIMDYFREHKSIRVTLIVSSKASAGVLKAASEARIPSLVLDKHEFLHGSGYVPILKRHGIDFIVLAGFLWKIPEALLNNFPSSIVNIHPALLPAHGGKGMYGAHVHEAVIGAAERESGITIHFVDGHYDGGDIIFQERCEVLPEDTPETLAQKIHELEYAHFPRIIEQVINLQNQR